MATETKTPKVRYDALVAHEYTVGEDKRTAWCGPQARSAEDSAP